jgi:hypothetical protein
MYTGWMAQMQGQTKKYSFCFAPLVFGQKKKEDFLRLAQRTLVSFDSHACNFAIMFGCIC